MTRMIQNWTWVAGIEGLPEQMLQNGTRNWAGRMQWKD